MSTPAESTAMVTFLENLVDEAGELVGMFEGFGCKDIRTYRAKFMKVFVTSTATALASLIWLSMHCKSFKRATAALDTITNMVLRTALQTLWPFLCESTAESDADATKFPLNKIAATFPEVCLSYAAARGWPAERIIGSDWFASLKLDKTLQAENEAAVKARWDAYKNKIITSGLRSGQKMTGFDAAIYENAKSDNIMTIGKGATPHMLTMVRLVAYIKANIVEDK